MVSPSFRPRIAFVVLPTDLNVHSIVPLRVGEEAIQNVHSPAPNTEYSPNCPARNSKLAATSESRNRSFSVRVSGVSSMMDSIRTRCGW